MNIYKDHKRFLVCPYSSVDVDIVVVVIVCIVCMSSNNTRRVLTRRPHDTADIGRLEGEKRIFRYFSQVGRIFDVFKV